MKIKVLSIKIFSPFIALAIAIFVICAPAAVGNSILFAQAAPADPVADPVDDALPVAQAAADAIAFKAADVASKAVISVGVPAKVAIASITGTDHSDSLMMSDGKNTQDTLVNLRSAINLNAHQKAEVSFWDESRQVTVLAEVDPANARGEDSKDDADATNLIVQDVDRKDSQLPEEESPEEQPSEEQPPEEQPPEFQPPEEEFKENKEGDTSEYEEGEKYKKRYPKGKYRTTVIVSEGRVLVASYDERGPQYAQATELSGSEKYVIEGEIK